MKCGLLGRKLGHSYSPQIHRFLGDYSYDLFEREPEDLDAFFADPPFDAMNVTIPYKETVMKYCSEISDSAKKIGSVNTIVRKNGKYYGDNTDYYGFEFILDSVCKDVKGKKVLIVGNGGAAKTAIAVISDRGGVPVVISHKENTPENMKKHHLDTDIIVNTTPVGMYPKNLESPIVLENYKNVQAVVDVVYNPSKTQILLDAERLGIPCVNGLYMLVAQAEKASAIFKGEASWEVRTSSIVSELELEMKNIVLVGMPGCGKSTIGRKIAEKLGRTFKDADDEVLAFSGKTPAEIITNEGETAFRKVETEVLKELCKQSATVVSTGGGCVTVNENFDVIRQNSVVVWVKRPLDMLATNGRPLSKSPEELKRMYGIRAPKYEKISDIIVENIGDLEKTVSDVLNSVERFVKEK
ncbi:MAG: shikimate kinase [Ruminococcaceae bacterium]|nr:shikimate kinase [Oscillospiraceae bacterium]